jgi:chaperonin cofactor prefoldin
MSYQADSRERRLTQLFLLSVQLVREIETQAIQAQQQISLVRTQLGAKQREKRLAQLTQSEISSLPSETPLYEGVGKM